MVGQTTEVARYLSLDWIDDLRVTALAHGPLIEAAAGRAITVTQLVTGCPEGDVSYHVVVADGTIEVGPGPLELSDVRFVQDHETAVAVATGTLNAQDAFINGRLRITGDLDRLVACQPVFAALDAVFHDVRERTDYGTVEG